MGLRDLRSRRRLSQEQVAEGVGISVSYLSRLETGERNISGKLVKKLARFFNCDPGEIFRPNSTTELVTRPLQSVIVVGHVQAGEWREAIEWEHDHQYSITIPMLRTTAKTIFGLEVRGESMNREYRPGDVVICVPLIEYHDELQNGKHVICEHVRSDGCIEATVKEFQREINGSAWLWPRSFSPEFQQPVQIGWPQAPASETSEEYRISAVVIGSFTNR